MYRAVAALLVFVLCLGSRPALAAEPNSATRPTVSAVAETYLDSFFDPSVLDAIVQAVSPDQRNEAAAFFRSQELRTRLVSAMATLLAKHYSSEEIQAMRDYDLSEHGRSTAKKLGPVTEEMQEFMMMYMVSAVGGQRPPLPKATMVDPPTLALAKSLAELHRQRLSAEMLEELKALPPKQRAQAEVALASPEGVELVLTALTGIVAKHFGALELKALVTFQSSELGRSVKQKEPAVLAEWQNVLRDHLRVSLQEFRKRTAPQ